MSSDTWGRDTSIAGNALVAGQVLWGTSMGWWKIMVECCCIIMQFILLNWDSLEEIFELSDFVDRSEESGARLIKVLLDTHSKKWPTTTNFLPFQNVHLKLLWMIMFPSKNCFANGTWFEQKNRLRLFHIWDLRNLMQIHLQNRRKSSTKIGSRQSDNPNLFRGQCSLMTLGTSMLFNHFPQTGSQQGIW